MSEHTIRLGPFSPPLQSERTALEAEAQALGQAAGEGRAAPVSTQPGAALLQVQGVSIDYRTRERVVRATHRVGFDVHAGDRFVLLGASGCGKSTLLKSIAGFIAPSEGQILLDGRAVTRPGPDRVVVFQEFDQLPPWKTVRDNVMFPLLASLGAMNPAMDLSSVDLPQPEAPSSTKRSPLCTSKPTRCVARTTRSRVR